MPSLAPGRPSCRHRWGQLWVSNCCRPSLCVTTLNVGSSSRSSDDVWQPVQSCVFVCEKDLKEKHIHHFRMTVSERTQKTWTLKECGKRGLCLKHFLKFICFNFKKIFSTPFECFSRGVSNTWDLIVNMMVKSFLSTTWLMCVPISSILIRVSLLLVSDKRFTASVNGEEEKILLKACVACGCFLCNKHEFIIFMRLCELLRFTTWF